MKNVVAFPDQETKQYRVFLVGMTLNVRGRSWHLTVDRFEIWDGGKEPVFVAARDSFCAVEQRRPAKPRRRK